jgi:hypothetical protein
VNCSDGEDNGLKGFDPMIIRDVVTRSDQLSLLVKATGAVDTRRRGVRTMTQLEPPARVS